MSNKEELGIEKNIKGFGTPMPKYEFQKQEIHAAPGGISEDMMEKAKKEPMPHIPPPSLLKEED